MNFLINILTSVFALTVLLSCTSKPPQETVATETRIVAVYHPVESQAEAGDVLEKWEDRLVDLKFISIETNDKDRHALIEKKISRLEKKLEDARVKFLDLKFASTEKKQGEYDKLNKVFSEATQIYNTSLAE